MVNPSQKQRAVQGVVQAGLCSQRRACRYLGLHRSSHRHPPKQPTEWLLFLHARIETFSHQYPRLGYRKLVRLLRRVGWQVGRKLVQRIRREHGLRVQRWTKRPRRRGRSTGTIPTRAQSINHVWSWDFVSDRTDNGGKLRILSVLDEHSRECLALQVARQLTAADLIIVLERLIAQRGVPAHRRSDNGSEFVARTLQSWLAERRVEDPLHRTRQPLAERARGELPRLVARRMPGSGTNAQRGRSARGHRGLPTLLLTRSGPTAASATALPRRRARKPRLGTPKNQTPCPPLDPLTKPATHTTQPNLSHVLDQSRGLDHLRNRRSVAIDPIS